MFMLSEDISKQVAFHMFDVDVTLQESLTLIFCIGFGLAKFPAVHVMSSAIYFKHRLKVLSFLVASSAVCLTIPLALSGGSPFPTLCGVFLGCFPSSMLYGGLVSYVEGRRSTEILIAIVHFSSTLAGSASRGTATAVLASGVAPCWMPAAIAVVVTPVILLMLWVLDRSPPPSTADVAARQPRQAMSAQQRADFINSFRPGLLLLISAYSLLTAVRFFRDLFSRDIFTAANGGIVPSSFVFATADLPGAIMAAGVLILFGKVEDSSRAMTLMISAMMLLTAVMLAATLLFSIEVLGCIGWQLVLGAGLYGTYSLACMPIYDRLVSASSFGSTGATCSFLVFYGDMCGYVGAVSLTLWKTFGTSNPAPTKVLEQFIGATIVLSVGILACQLAAQRYFKERFKQLVWTE